MGGGTIFVDSTIFFFMSVVFRLINGGRLRVDVRSTGGDRTFFLGDLVGCGGGGGWCCVWIYKCRRKNSKFEKIKAKRCKAYISIYPMAGCSSLDEFSTQRKERRTQLNQPHSQAEESLV